MARLPYNVLVIPFRTGAESPPLFCALRRSDAGYWQWVAGGGETGETPIDAARRETREETGIHSPALIPLSMEARVPVHNFAAARTLWPADLYVIPEYCFAVEAPSADIVLSREHSEFRWATYDEAMDLLHWQSNQSALWELNERIRREDLHA